MSTASSESLNSESVHGTGIPTSNSARRLEDVRASLVSHVQKTAQFIKILDSLMLVFAWLSIALLTWLLACLVDHWLLPLPRLARWAIWLSCVAGVLWSIWRHLIPLIINSINPVYAARRIEQLVPEFKNGLVSWLELQSMPEQGIPRGVMAALTYRAARFLGGHDPSATVDTGGLIKLIGIVLMLVTSLVVYTMLSPKSVLETGKRIAMPWLNLDSPTRVHLLEVLPGDVVITQGKPLTVEIEVRGLRYGESAYVHFDTVDGQLKNQTVELTALTEGLRYSGVVKTSNEGVEQELVYWITAGDTRSEKFRVKINPLPSIFLESLQLSFPAYTQLDPQQVDPSSTIEAVEGTVVSLGAKANQPMRRARLEVNPELDSSGEFVRSDALIDLSVEGPVLTGQWILRRKEGDENPSKQLYRIRGSNENGDYNPRPIAHSALVFSDVPPEINLLGPESRLLRVTANAKLNFEIRASDPDYGLSKISVDVRHNNQLLRNVVLLEETRAVGQQVKNLRMDLGKLNPAVGDQIYLQAIAADNRHDPLTQRPSPNVTKSEPLMLIIVEPQRADPDLPQLEENAPEKTEEQSQPSGEQADSRSKPRQQSSGTTPRNQAGSGSDTASNEDAGAEPQRNEAESNSAENGSQSSNSQSQNSGGESQSAGNQSGGSQQDAVPPKNQSGSSAGAQSQGSGNAEGTQDSGAQGGSGSRSTSQSSSGSQKSSGQSGATSASSGTDSAKSSATQSGSNSRSGQDSQAGSNTQGKAQDGTQPAGAERSSEGGSASGAGSRGDSGSQGEGISKEDRGIMERVKEFMDSRSASDPSSGESSSRPNANGSDSDGPKSNESRSGADSKGTESKSSSGKSSAGAEGDRGAADSTESPANPDAQNDGNKAAGQQGGDEQGGEQNEKKNSGQSSPNGSGTESDSNRSSRAQGNEAASQSSDSANGNKSADQGGASQQPSQSGGESGAAQTQGNQTQGNQTQGNQTRGNQTQGNQTQSASSGAEPASGAQSGDSSDSGSSDSKASENGGSESGSKGQSGSEGSSGQSQADSKAQTDSPNSPQSSSGNQGDSNSSQSSSGSQSSAGSQSSSGSQSGSSDSSSSASQGKGEESGQSSSETTSESPQQASEQGASSSESANGASSGSSSSGEPGKSSGSPGQNGKASEGGSSGPSAASQGVNSGAARGGEGGDSGVSEKANADYSDEASNLVLDYLQRQKDQPDPELLRELNWSREDLSDFVDRWTAARNLRGESADAATRKDRDLGGLQLGSPRNENASGSANNDNFNKQLDAGSRFTPPPKLRKQFEAFQKAMQGNN